MGYYGASAYRGDYYGQGDYYRSVAGDPGFFDFLGGVASTIGGVASKVLPIAAPILGGAFGGPVGAALGGVAGGLIGRVLGPGPPIPNPPAMQLPPTWAATSPGTTSTAAMIPFMPPTFTGLQVGGPAGVQIGRRTGMPGGSPVRASAAMLTIPPMLRRPRGQHVQGAHRRRLNPLNPRALGRALRRARGFQKYATKVLKLVGEKRHVDGFKHHRKKKS